MVGKATVTMYKENDPLSLAPLLYWISVCFELNNFSKLYDWQTKNIFFWKLDFEINLAVLEFSLVHL